MFNRCLCELGDDIRVSVASNFIWPVMSDHVFNVGTLGYYYYASHLTEKGIPGLLLSWLINV